MKHWLGSALVTVQLAFAGCAAPARPPSATTPPAAATPAAAPSAAEARQGPPPECLAALEKLSQGIPRDETGPVLRSKGLRIKTPIQVPDEVITEKQQTNAARVRVLIDSKGQVIPGSVTVQQAIGDPKLPLAMSQMVPATLSFDVAGAFTVPKEFAFTTVYVSCARP